MKYWLKIWHILEVILLISSLALQSHCVKFKQVLINSNEQTFSILNDSATNRTKILVGIQIRDQSYSLPTFLATLETLKCPSESKKCNLLVIFDRCTDTSYEMFIEWLSNTKKLFDTVKIIDTKNDELEMEPLYLSSILKIRTIKYAMDNKFNYIFYLNADNILINPNTIEILINKQKIIVAPLLTSSETSYSTFWTQNSQKFYNEDERYFSIYDRNKLGCFIVQGVQEAFLMNLNDPRLGNILENEKGSNEMLENFTDDLWLNQKLKSLNILTFVCNKEIFGYIPDRAFDMGYDPIESFVHLRIEHLLKGPNKTFHEPLAKTKFVDKKKVENEKNKTSMGFDQIYIINLEQRKDRRRRIESALADLNLTYKLTKAVDGNAIDEEYLKKLGIQVIPGYKDPHNDRPINFGEIGCFLSHYFIWKNMVENNYEKIIILEDDARFLLNFKSNLDYIVNAMKNKEVKWDLLYLGRKIMKKHDESWDRRIPFKNGHGIVKPSYTYWTIAYALTLEGAKKLLESDPLKKILPIDELLPILFDKHPNKYWSSFYPKRNLKAYAIQPSIIMPTHYTNEPSHVSDTENSRIINTELIKPKEKMDDMIGLQLDSSFRILNVHSDL